MAIGRKRKTGARQPNGALRRSRVDLAPKVVQYQRAVRNAEEFGTDLAVAGEIGRLTFCGELTKLQGDVASRVGEVYGRFERLIGVSRSAKGFAYEVGYAAFGISEDLLTPEQIAHREHLEIEARKRFDELQVKLRQLPRDLVDAIETLCVEDAHPLPIYYEQIRAFLNHLAVVWKMRANRGPSNAGRTAARTAVAHAEQIASGEAAPARPKPNVDRIATLKFIRALRPDLDGDDLQEAYELARAVRDQTAHRFKTDRSREKRGKGPAYVPPADDITTAAAITNRPVLSLPGQPEHA